ncbi:MAG: phage holin family protein [Bdellovibrionales bacterium]|nr:phage holin family protein [Bdellovibrionales bacterium]
MLYLLVIWLCSSSLLFMSSRVVEGFELPYITSAVFLCILMGLFNVFIRPLLVALQLPVTLMTLGLFSFSINAVFLKLTDGFTPDLMIESWAPAFLASLLLTILQLTGNLLLPGSRNFVSKY